MPSLPACSIAAFLVAGIGATALATPAFESSRRPGPQARAHGHLSLQPPSGLSGLVLAAALTLSRDSPLSQSQMGMTSLTHFRRRIATMAVAREPMTTMNPYVKFVFVGKAS